MNRKRNKRTAGFLFAFTDDVQDQVWEYILEIGDIENQILRIFDLDMISFLIWATNGYHLISDENDDR